MAKGFAAEANARLGLSESDAEDIIISSMAAGNREEQAKEDAADRWARIKSGRLTREQEERLLGRNG